MGSRKTLPFVAAGLALALTLTGCSKNTSDQETSDLARTIRIQALDTNTFEPDSVTVKVAKRLRFVVTNLGHIEHEFFLGDEAAQIAHGEEMGMGSGMQHGGKAVAALELAPGETREARVTFDQPGTILYGCHEPGHYKGGMVGTITVTG